MWNYVYYMVHVWSTPQNDYSGPEKYVADCLRQDLLDWYPADRAMSVSEAKSGERNQLQEQLQQFAQVVREGIEKKLQGMANKGGGGPHSEALPIALGELQHTGSPKHLMLARSVSGAASSSPVQRMPPPLQSPLKRKNV